MIPSMLPEQGHARVMNSAEFIAAFADTGSGIVDISLSRGTGTGTKSRALAAFAMQSDGTLVSVASGTMRSNYSAAGVYQGFLIEGALVNRCLQSQVFENVAWVASNITKTDNDAVAPDGTSTAALLLATAGNGTVIQDLGVVGSAEKTGSLWIKRKTGTGNIDLTMDDGAGWSTQSVTTTWTRFSVTQTLANEGFGIRIVTDTDAVWVWQGQVETSGFPSSDIVTTTVGISRPLDVLNYVFADNMDTAIGSYYLECSVIWSGAAPSTPVLLNNGASTLLYMATNPTTYKMDDGTNTATKTLTNANTGVRKRAGSWGSALNLTGDGAAVTSATFDGAMTNTNISIGSTSAGTAPFYGTVKNLRIWKRQLTDEEMSAITG